MCWIGDLDGYGVDIFTQFKNPASGPFYTWGYNTDSPVINKSNDNSSFIIAWSQDNGAVNKFVDNNLTPIKTLNTTGRDIQVNNGVTKSSMYGMVFKPVSSLYTFTVSNSFGSFYKIAETGISSGRQGVVYKDNAEFYFMVGDVTVNGQFVDFVEIPDTILFSDSQELNQYLISEPFMLNNNSDFKFSVRYGVTDSSSASLLLQEGKQISFKLQLIDNSTGEILGEFDNVEYRSSNVNSHDNLSYQVNTAGIGNKEVVLMLITDNNFDPEYSLTTRYNDGEVLAKTSSQQITFNNNQLINSYDLAQNYPNPFNPATIIKYQIPKDGMVTLKIYDILGKEVKTLVNEQKPTGRYEVKFDASDLASGVYIYRIQVNPATSSGQVFVSTKKMMLLK